MSGCGLLIRGAQIVHINEDNGKICCSSTKCKFYSTHHPPPPLPLLDTSVISLLLVFFHFYFTTNTTFLLFSILLLVQIVFKQHQIGFKSFYTFSQIFNLNSYRIMLLQVALFITHCKYLIVAVNLIIKKNYLTQHSNWDVDRKKDRI